MFATIWSKIFAMQLPVLATFDLRSIYEQRLVCDCLVHAVPDRDQRVNVKSVAGGFLNSISDYKDYAFYYNNDKITAYI